jgi:hypothetical protein
MSAYAQMTWTGLALLVFFLLICGCVSSNVGDISYTGSGLSATINNPGQPADGFIQVTIYKVNGLVQQEYTVVMKGMKLESGQNTVIIPVTLESGSYKLNIYLFEKGERKSAVIRDIVV